jgi:hypothetical protein
MRWIGSMLLTVLLCASAACDDDTSETADAARPPLDAGNDGARDLALEAVISSDGTSIRDTAAGEALDAVTDGVSQSCPALSEEACLSNAGCTRIRGLSLEDFCAGRMAAAFAGCVTGGPDGGAAIIWGREDRSGRTAQFSTTQLPAGWTQVGMPACPGDGGIQ